MAIPVYLCPLTGGPIEHDAPALAGSAVRAGWFELIVREGSTLRSRWRLEAAKVPEALADLPADLREEAERQWASLTTARPPLAAGAASIPFDQPRVMAILNVTPDSFSDGGRFVDEARQCQHAERMLADGATLVDVGGESTRPGAEPVEEDEELRRVMPAISMLARMGATISVDTRRAAVMEAALAAGAHVINDVSALRGDPRSLDVVARSGAGVVLMHAPGEGENLHAGRSYGKVVFDVFDFLRERRDAAIAGGIAPERIVLDPGIGFGKSLADNLALMRALPLFHALGQPLLVGASRKRMIATLSAGGSADRRLGGSLALALKAIDAGVQLHRVHDVAETVQAIQVWSALSAGPSTSSAERA